MPTQYKYPIFKGRIAVRSTMKREFIETEVFQSQWASLGLPEKDLSRLQNTLLVKPESGAVIQGTGGLRKIRITTGVKGKRGGARVIYVDFVIKEQIYLLLVYGKNEQSALTPSQKKAVSEFVKRIKEE